MTSAAILFLFPACMIFATVCDVTTMKIPNKIIVALLAGFAVVVPVSGMSFDAAGIHLATAAIVLLIGFGSWMLGFLGAGDVKLLAAASLWLGPVQTVPFVVYVGLFGGVAIIALLLWRRRMLPMFLTQVGWVNRLHQPNSEVPYGVAIAPAALLVFLDSPLAKFAMTGNFFG